MKILCLHTMSTNARKLKCQRGNFSFAQSISFSVWFWWMDFDFSTSAVQSFRNKCIVCSYQYCHSCRFFDCYCGLFLFLLCPSIMKKNLWFHLQNSFLKLNSSFHHIFARTLACFFICSFVWSISTAKLITHTHG